MRERHEGRLERAVAGAHAEELDYYEGAPCRGRDRGHGDGEGENDGADAGCARYNLFYRTSTHGRYGRRTAPRVAKERYDGEVSTCVNGLVDTNQWMRKQ